jgi:hypothetical protein
MSEISNIDSLNARLAPSDQITEITDDFKVPQADQGRYKVLICTPSHTQSFITSPGDTIRKKEVRNQGWVQDPHDTKYITLYPDDFIHSEYTGNNGELVTAQRPFTLDMPGFDIHAPHPMSIKLRSVSNGDRSLATLQTGEVLSVRREPLWSLERELGDGSGTYVIGTLGTEDQAGYAKCTEGTTLGGSWTLRSNASGM